MAAGRNITHVGLGFDSSLFVNCLVICAYLCAFFTCMTLAVMICELKPLSLSARLSQIQR